MDTNDVRVERLLAGDERPIDSEGALRRFAERARSEGAMPHRARRAWLRPAAVAAAVLVFALAGATGVADTLFTIFQPKQVAPVTVRATDVAGLPDLREFGTITWKVRPEQAQAATLDAAARATGITPLRATTLPSGVTGDARIYTISRGEAQFAFDEAKLQGSAATVGRTPPPMPASIASSTLTMTGGPGIVQSWGGSFDATAPERIPALLIAESKAPVVSSNGATLDELRAYLLAQPGLSPQLAQQIRQIGDPGSTLLVPIPIDMASGRPVTVRGVQGVLVGDQTGLGSAVFWVADGIVHVVGGALPDSELLAIANALR